MRRRVHFRDRVATTVCRTGAAIATSASASVAIQRLCDRRRDWRAVRLFRRIDNVVIEDAGVCLDREIVVPRGMTLIFRRCVIDFVAEPPAEVLDQAVTARVVNGVVDFSVADLPRCERGIVALTEGTRLTLRNALQRQREALE